MTKTSERTVKLHGVTDLALLEAHGEGASRGREITPAMLDGVELRLGPAAAAVLAHVPDGVEVNATWAADLTFAYDVGLFGRQSPLRIVDGLISRLELVPE